MRRYEQDKGISCQLNNRQVGPFFFPLYLVLLSSFLEYIKINSYFLVFIFLFLFGYSVLTQKHILGFTSFQSFIKVKSSFVLNVAWITYLIIFISFIFCFYKLSFILSISLTTQWQSPGKYGEDMLIKCS